MWHRPQTGRCLWCLSHPRRECRWCFGEHQVLTTLFFIKHLSRAYPGAKEGNPDPLSTQEPGPCPQDLCISRASSAATLLQEAPEHLPAGRGTPARSLPLFIQKCWGIFRRQRNFLMTSTRCCKQGQRESRPCSLQQNRSRGRASNLTPFPLVAPSAQNVLLGHPRASSDVPSLNQPRPIHSWGERGNTQQRFGQAPFSPSLLGCCLLTSASAPGTCFFPILG